MDRVRALWLWWEHLERRALPARTPLAVTSALTLVMLALLIWNLVRDVHFLLTIPIDDIRAYECYARAFWRGSQAMVDAPQTRLCSAHAFQFWVAPPRAFHTMPREYPAPALTIFSLPLLVPVQHYNIAFMELMALLIVGVTAWLGMHRLLGCAVAFALYVLLGGWATALARYDLVPGVLVLGALVLAERQRFRASYLLLAAGTLVKVFPAFLVPILAAHQWHATGKAPWRDLRLYALVVVAGLLPGLLLDPGNFLMPLGYNSIRPPQIESVAGSLLWLSGRIGGGVRVRLTYHSLNVTGMLAGPAAWLATLVLVGGLVVVTWRAWRGQDTLGRSFVLALLITLCGSKLLSPQYLLWVFPVAAYVDGLRLRWSLLAWLTLMIYPFAYGFKTSMVRLPEHPIFMGSILSRNAVLVALAIIYLLPERKVVPVALPARATGEYEKVPVLRAVSQESAS
jgi:hypothetical protein